jgi:hypothetical protein
MPYCLLRLISRLVFTFWPSRFRGSHFYRLYIWFPKRNHSFKSWKDTENASLIYQYLTVQAAVYTNILTRCYCYVYSWVALFTLGLSEKICVKFFSQGHNVGLPRPRLEPYTFRFKIKFSFTSSYYKMLGMFIAFRCSLFTNT